MGPLPLGGFGGGGGSGATALRPPALGGETEVGASGWLTGLGRPGLGSGVVGRGGMVRQPSWGHRPRVCGEGWRGRRPGPGALQWGVEIWEGRWGRRPGLPPWGGPSRCGEGRGEGGNGRPGWGWEGVSPWCGVGREG